MSFISLTFFSSLRSATMASGVANHVAIYKTMWATFQVNWCWVLVSFTSFLFYFFYFSLLWFRWRFVVVGKVFIFIRFNIKNFSLVACGTVAGSAGHRVSMHCLSYTRLHTVHALVGPVYVYMCVRVCVCVSHFIFETLGVGRLYNCSLLHVPCAAISKTNKRLSHNTIFVHAKRYATIV